MVGRRGNNGRPAGEAGCYGTPVRWGEKEGGGVIIALIIARNNENVKFFI